MAQIHILDNNTIDKIAAGEVIERPMSIVKELVENSIDAGATIITVEIKNGGLKLIRVTDNGTGIDADQIRNAFVSHATSKISNSDDLRALYTLGFRGEALSSIAAVSRVEVTSRTADSITGIHYCIEGGNEIKCEQIGAPLGTTFLIRDIFYNTLPRLKFLKSEAMEGSYITDLMEHLALSMPGISFNFISNGQTKFSTSGRGDLKEVIYRIFGRDMASHLRQIDCFDDQLNLRVHGYLGLPIINRSNRAGEIFFINHRFIKSRLLSKAVEEGYIEYLMQHMFPFCVLNLDFDPGKIDVNVHPTKQEVRITQEKAVYSSIVDFISTTLASREMIDEADAEIKPKAVAPSASEEKLPQQFEQKRIVSLAGDAAVPVMQRTNDNTVSASAIGQTSAFGISPEASSSVKSEKTADTGQKTEIISEELFFEDSTGIEIPQAASPKTDVAPVLADTKAEEEIKEYKQLDFLSNERLLSPQARREYRIIGQVFKTYWLIEYKDELMIMDQHAAHEKVNFERFMAHFKNKTEIPSQQISPPAIMNLSHADMDILKNNLPRFEELGFAIEDFGEHDIAVRAIPMDLYGASPQDIISEVLSELASMHKSTTPDIIRTRIATYACKASIKGNNFVSVNEIEELLDEMLTLENPYNCPHGRPTLIRISKTELEKRFHRIV